MTRAVRYYAKPRAPQQAPSAGSQPAGARPAAYGMDTPAAWQQAASQTAAAAQAAAHQQHRYGARYPGAPVAGAVPQAALQGAPNAANPAAVPAYAYPAAVAQQPGMAPRPAAPQHAGKKRRRGLTVAVIIAVLCLIAAGAIAWCALNGPAPARSGTPGQLEGKSPAEMQAELDRIVEEGMFNISIASVVQVPSGTSPAELRIENVPGNRYLMKVQIALDDTGEVVYSTDAIEPNFHIQQDTLDVVLPAGAYNATATFTALEPDTEQEVGTAAAKVLIQVQS